MAQGLETDVYGVPAYSTLGWTNLLGGDPLLNTFVNYPEGELARMIFHELAHQAVYVQGDTVFNESFATAVERLGAQRWLAQHASPAAQAEYALGNQRRSQFQALTRATRQTLLGIYAQYPQGQAPAPALKQQALDDFRASYAQLKAQWGGFAGYDAWVQRANNASFAAVSAYDELVPGFEALFEHVGQSWPKFYDAVQALARLPLSERSTALKTKHFTETSGG